MFAPLLSAFVVMLPLNAGDDQATVSRLVAEGGVTLVQTSRVHPYRSGVLSGAVASWSVSAPCRSSGMVLAGHARRFDVDRASDEISIAQDSTAVTVVQRKPTMLDQTLVFTFADEAKAGEAVLAFRRLRGACTAQR